MRYVFGTGIILQLALIVIPAISAETQLPAPSSPTQPLTQQLQPPSTTVSKQSQDGSAPCNLTQPNTKTQLSERDRLILERYLLRIIPNTSD